ncbi:T9SS C-terminal target domain-containing protein [Mariniphaga sediminis]|uniref:T9SS C-terminal target domain-containing protein n=2 Tax=Mariniphaga sediminis TaxID=1628158 RepID=A0A399D7J8_9BACT|nr:T9SS C-terminal target domain-containing protein [Mariniphaga sediminis]RIH66522.1 T9SS C-terminal target domain-containing protein [Mariniphaga sediminis]
MRWFFLTVFFLFSTTCVVTGQVSSGGTPLKVPILKSRGIPVKTMPELNNKALQQQAAEQRQQGNRLKAFQFAHTFQVHLSPETDGLWTNNIDGFDIWQLKIRSKDAFSIQLIFDRFKLPYNARLFLFSEKEGKHLGAFTSINNKASGKFAVAPLAGDELVVQYEVPAGHNGKNDFVISNVNHDFIGILKFSDRRPLGTAAGECNIDIHCEAGSDWEDPKDAVCRIITTKNNKAEICTGTLINNTAEDQKPYVITAAHCIEKAQFAETSVFTFNYESPYCAPLDGDPGNSVSNAVLRAISDSLDFALVELSLVPPPEYRPYYAGWDNRQVLPDSSTSIHHPQGDIKKIAYDSDSPVYSNFLSDYTPKGFIRILRWDGGVTEHGSSGGPLFNPDQNLIGTLTGGSALCSDPRNDYFSRFEMAWEFRADISKQLKHWLDPLNSGATILQGKRFYTDEELCMAFTNLEDFDEHENIVLQNENQFAGYWGGTNNIGITGFAERFSIPGNEQFYGVSLGVGKVILSGGTDSEITVTVYNGNSPGTVIHSETVKINSLVSDAMNFIGFSEMVEPADTFFVGFELSNLAPQDTFVVYQSLRQPEKENFFWFKQNNEWYNFQTSNNDNYCIANAFELIACNVDALANDTPLVNNPTDALIYPNPAHSGFTFEAGQEIDPENIRVFNLIGQEVQAKLGNHRNKKIQIDLSGNIPGVYFVRLKTGEGMVSKKVTYMPW